MPMFALAATLFVTTALGATTAPANDIPAAIASTGVHNTLLAALDKTDLVGDLEEPGPYTVFAPTDAAFAAAGIDVNNFNSTEEIASLTNVLEYHVYVGEVLAADIKDGQTITMLNGDDATLHVRDGKVTINAAAVTRADVLASNGVIHVVDAVLTPPESTGSSRNLTALWVVLALVVAAAIGIAAFYFLRKRSVLRAANYEAL